MPPTHADRFSIFSYIILLIISVTSVIVMHEVFMAIALELTDIPRAESVSEKQ